MAVSILEPGALRTELKRGHRAPVYLLAGADSFRAERTARWLREHSVQTDMADFNTEVLYADEVPPERIVESASSYPMFGGARFLWVRHAEALPSGAALGSLLQYLERPVETTLLVLTASKLDKRLKLTTACAEAGRVVEFAPLSGNALVAQVIRQGKEHGLGLTRDAAEGLVALVGEDLGELDGELAKLALFGVGEGGEISGEELRTLVARSRDINAFALADALDGSRPGPALRSWLTLRSGGGDVMGAAAILGWRLRQLVQIRAALDAGDNPQSAARRLGLAPWQTRRLGPLAESSSSQRLAGALEAWREADRRAKSTSLGDGLAYDLALLSWAAGEP